VLEHALEKERRSTDRSAGRAKTKAPGRSASDSLIAIWKSTFVERPGADRPFLFFRWRACAQTSTSVILRFTPC